MRLCCIDHAGAENQVNSREKKVELERKEQHLEALLQSVDEAGQHRSLTALDGSHGDMLASENDDLPAAEAYQNNCAKLVLAALLRSVEVAQQRMKRAGDEWWSPIDHKTAACLYDVSNNLTTPIDDRLRRAIDEDVKSEGGHRAVVLQGAEGTGRSTALRRFVQLVASSSPELPPPVVVARCLMWPGRMAVDLLCDVVSQLNAVVGVVNVPSSHNDSAADPAAFNQHIDLDSLVRSYANLLRAFSESRPGRLVVALDGLESVREGCTVGGGDIKWLAVPLPARVHVVATYLICAETDSLPSVTDVYGGRTVRTIDITELSESAINHVVTEAFRRRRRRPPVEGRLSVIMQLLGTKPRVAYVALLADEFAARSEATSTSPAGQLERSFERLENIEKIAKERFTRAERHYGKSVVCATVIRLYFLFIAIIARINIANQCDGCISSQVVKYNTH